MNGGRFFFWRSKPRRDQLAADLEYPVTWDDAGATKRLKKILSWGLGAASVGVVYATAGSVVWSAYDQLGRHGVAAPPPLIIVEAATFKAAPGEQAEHVDPERGRLPVGVTVLARADQLAARDEAVLPPAPQMSIKLAAAHQLSAQAEPARLEDEERPQSMVALMAPKPSRDLLATAEANSPSGSVVSPPPPTPSFKPTRSSAPIEVATLGLPKPAFKPNPEVAVAAAPAARIEPVSSPIDYLRNWFGRVVAVMEAGALASDRFFVASGDRGDRNDGGGGSSQASGGSVADSGGASNDAASSSGNDRGSGNNGNGNNGNGNGNGNGRGDRDDDD